MAEVRIPLYTAFFGNGIKDAEKQFEQLGGKIKSFGKGIAASLGSAFVGAKAFGFVQNSVSAAADLQQAMSGVKTIFGDMQPQIDGFIKSGTSMGMTMAETAKAVTFLGSVFKQTGMPMQDVIGHTEQMTKLAADLAATYGYSVEEALTAMTATFRGEYDPIEKFGVAMKQQQVNAELAARGLKGLTGSALIAAQQQIRYEMILQRTTDASGAFARQSGNLSTQMAVLKAVWVDMQAKLGMKLVPILAQITVMMQPLIQNLAPHLAKAFLAIAHAVVALAPLLPKLADLFAKSFDTVANVMAAATPLTSGLLNLLIDHLPGVLAFVAAMSSWKTVVPIIQNLRVQYKLLMMEMGKNESAIVFAELAGGMAKATTGLKLLKIAQLGFNAAVKANAWLLIITAIAGAADVISNIVSGAKKNADQFNKDLNTIPRAIYNQAKAAGDLAVKAAEANKAVTIDTTLAYHNAMQQVIDEYKNGLKEIDRQNTAWAGRYPSGAMYEALYGKKPVMQSNGAASTNTGKAVKTWFDNLADEIAKQSGRMKLQKLGLSQTIIDSLLSASDWKTALAKVLGMTKSEIKKLIADFDKTAAGVQDLTDRTAKFVDAVKARIDTIKSLTGSLSDFMPKTLAEVNRQVGQFEGDIVSAADTLKSSLQTALDNKSITQAAYNNLTAYANREIAVLQKVAAQRDALVAKIEAAKSTYLEVAQAVRSYGNITSTSTQQITESYVKWIDGVEVTVSRTVDALKNTDLVQTYQDIVNKTKQFVQNLASLKKMGLNSTLFKQIVDAGVDAGGATAAAIVSGGQDTVSSMNDLFSQLDSAGQQMADMTAQVMSDNGVTIVSAFIDGLTSQEQALADQAASMAKIFSDAFSNNVKFSIPTVKASDFGLTDKQAADALKDAGLPSDQGGSGANDFGITILDPLKTALPTIADAVTTISTGLDRVERAGAGIGALASVNTSAATGYASAGWSLSSLPASATALGTAPTYNVTVNAGIGTDGAGVGQTIVNMIKQYERNSGAVWQSAVY